MLNLKDSIEIFVEKEPSYFHYKGSLTVPPCNEAVNWHVFRKVLPISKKVMDFFRDTFINDPSFSKGNGDFRPVQPVHQRRVYISNYGGYLPAAKAWSTNHGLLITLGLATVSSLLMLIFYGSARKGYDRLPSAKASGKLEEKKEKMDGAEVIIDETSKIII
jgi:hypothetical protein